MPADASKTGNVAVYRLKAMADLATAEVPDCKRVATGEDQPTGFRYSLWTINPPAVTPSWFGPFRDLIDDHPKTRVAGFVLLVNAADSSYAFVGGIGRHKLIKRFEIEARFGITIAKRIVRELTTLKGLAQRDVGGSVHTIDRAFRRSYDPKLDIDNLHRILRQMKGSIEKGSSEYREIGSSISAGDSLVVRGSKDFSAMLRFLKKVDELWHSADTGMDIPELRAINRRTEKPLIDALQAALAAEIRKFNHNEHIEQPPDLFIDNIDVGYLPDHVLKYTVIYKGRTEHETQSDVFKKLAEIIETPIAENEEGQAHARLNQIRLSLHLEDGIDAGPFRLMTLMCGDVPFNNDSYFIDGGDWFKADEVYISKLNAQLGQVTCFAPGDLELQEWVAGEERDYNSGHATSSFAVLDRHLVRVASEKAGVEFCDLLWQDTTKARLIHVKRATGAELRALFAQGCVSAELYAYDDEFRDNTHTAQMSASNTLTDGDKAALDALRSIPPDRKCVVYAIADPTPGHVPILEDPPTVAGILNGTLSLFAKVDLFRRVRTIRELGMHVAVTRIKPYPT